MNLKQQHQQYIIQPTNKETKLERKKKEYIQFFKLS